MQSRGSNRLTVRQGPTPGKVYELVKEMVTVGRDVSNDIAINDAEVSRNHARLTAQSGGYLIEDLASTNGTFVNGQRLIGPKLLNAGDVVGFGETVVIEFGFVADAGATVIASAPMRAAPPPEPKPEPEPAYQAPPAYEPEPEPAYQPPPAYEPEPAYQAPPAYEPEPAYQAPPAYEGAQVYSATPSYEPAPAYQTSPMNDAPATMSEPVYSSDPIPPPMNAPAAPPAKPNNTVKYVGIGCGCLTLCACVSVIAVYILPMIQAILFDMGLF